MKDLDRDEHLRAALRHAPDADLAAPPDVSAQILAAARRAAAERPAAPPRRRPWWALDTPRRLGASGAFASLLLAGFIGLLWRGEAPGPATESDRVAMAPATDATAPAPTLPAAATSAPAAPAAVAVRATAPAVPARSPAVAAAKEEAPRLAAMKQTMPATPPPVAALSKPAVEADTALNTVTPPSPPAAAAAADRNTVTAAAAPAPAAVMALTERRARAEAAREMAAGRAAATPAIMAVARPSGPWMDALAEGGAVQWKVDGASRAPSSSWLYALAEQTQGRWRAAAITVPDAGDNEVQWLKDGMLTGRLWLGAERVLWCDGRGRCEEAPLAVDVTTALRKGLAR